eukprot:scaffold81207_cov18-Tisochrysis_lutea.AAC.1
MGWHKAHHCKTAVPFTWAPPGSRPPKMRRTTACLSNVGRAPAALPDAAAAVPPEGPLSTTLRPGLLPAACVR